MSLQSASVLVTGGTGFVGSRLVEVLVEQFGARVKIPLRAAGLGAGAFRAACYDVEFVDASILDEDALRDALKDVEYVFHCAFGSHGNERAQREVTVGGTGTVVRAATKAGVKRFVNLSTIVVFGDRTPNIVDETFTPVKPWRWNYARDKWKAEQLVVAEQTSNGLITTTVRLGAVYGPWGPAFTLGPLRTLSTHRIALPAHGSGVSSATYIDDAVQGIILAAQGAQTAPETYVIVGADRVNWRQFYAAYEAMTGCQGTVPMTIDEINQARRARLKKGLKTVLPAAINALIENKAFREASADLPLIPTVYAKLSRWKRPNLSPSYATVSQPLPLTLPPNEMIGYLSSQTEYSSKKATEKLGYSPKFDLSTGMELTAEWARWARIL